MLGYVDSATTTWPTDSVLGRHLELADQRPSREPPAALGGMAGMGVEDLAAVRAGN